MVKSWPFFYLAKNASQGRKMRIWVADLMEASALLYLSQEWKQKRLHKEVLGLSSVYSISHSREGVHEDTCSGSWPNEQGRFRTSPGEKQRWAWEIYHHTLRCFSKQTRCGNTTGGNLFLKNSTEARNCGWELRYLNKLTYSSEALKKRKQKNAILIYG